MSLRSILSAIAGVTTFIGVIVIVHFGGVSLEVDGPKAVAALKKNRSRVREEIRRAAPGEDVSFSVRGNTLHVTVGDKGWIRLYLEDREIKMSVRPDTHRLYPGEVRSRRAYLTGVGEAIKRRLIGVIASG